MKLPEYFLTQRTSNVCDDLVIVELKKSDVICECKLFGETIFVTKQVYHNKTKGGWCVAIIKKYGGMITTAESLCPTINETPEEMLCNAISAIMSTCGKEAFAKLLKQYRKEVLSKAKKIVLPYGRKDK